jgi:hypothetical protein
MVDKNEVYIAFEILLEEIEAVANSIREAGSQAFQRGSYDEAQRMIEVATRLADFRDKVKGLQREWSDLFAKHVPKVKRKGQRRKFEKLPRGLRTPEKAFRRPILEVLVELGGRARIDEVLRKVEERMQGVLNSSDLQPLPSNPHTIRWQNTAQWCRYKLVREGLLKDDSPRGIWEISERGRETLQRGRV